MPRSYTLSRGSSRQAVGCRARWSLGITAIAGLSLSLTASALNTEHLEPSEQEVLHALLHRLEPLIAEKKKDGTANILSWETLYEPLEKEQRLFLDQFRSLKASTLGSTSHYFGEPGIPPELVPVGPQFVLREGKAAPLDPQYLPRDVLDVYLVMMDSMEADLGTRLPIESGYRSPAYQLYLFLYYLPNHDYSVIETNRFVALPGHSEHGHPLRQAVDFINMEGINGEDNPEEFEVLPEYKWLTRHAGKFGFVLSYPRNNPYNTAFEPWHWHYRPE